MWKPFIGRPAAIFSMLLLTAMLCITQATAQTATPVQQPLLTGKAAMSDWKSDAPGVRRKIVFDDLPPPRATPSASNFANVIARPAGAMPKVPPGFIVDLIAQGFQNPRKIVAAPNGDLFIAESEANRVSILRQGADGKFTKTIYAANLDQPFGIAFYPPGPDPQFVYVGNTGSVVRFPYHAGDLTASGAKATIVPDIPSGGRLAGGGHWTRDVVFSPDGKKMYVSVGSQSNVGDSPAEKNRADILEYNPNGTGFRIFATGIRNAVGLAIEPQTKAIWASVNERDELGDNMPCDYITHVEDSGFYGWPWFYLGPHEDPRMAGRHPELASKVIMPDVLIQAHSASLCMTFYTATQFPPAYRGGAFAAEHGSWNRAMRTGYKVIFVPMTAGKSTGEYDDFLTGFVTPTGEVWGRPVGVAVDNQGSLIITDDGGNCVWRVRYTAAARP